jgi:hypothetical protein
VLGRPPRVVEADHLRLQQVALDVRLQKQHLLAAAVVPVVERRARDIGSVSSELSADAFDRR